ncbi:MAG: lipoate--protein ligase family protein [Pseudomonadota bacterium]
MGAPFRVIDTGVMDGRMNIAFDQALIDLHVEGAIPDTIRFLQFQPSVLVGRHQALSRELHLDYCAANHIQTVRRITGGGALYMDQGQLGFELVFSRKTLGITSLSELAKAICEAAAVGYQRLGIDAHYRPRNDIEVGGRKISGTGGFFDGDTIFYQCTLLIDLDPEVMFSALNVPQEKLAKKNLETASARMVTLRELLGDKTPALREIEEAILEGFRDELGIAPAWGAVSELETKTAQDLHDDEIGTDAFVAEIDDVAGPGPVLSGSTTGPGGTVTAHVRLEDKRIAGVLITGDFFVTPPRTVIDLEASLRGIDVKDIASHVESFFAANSVDLLTVAPADFSSAIELAIGSGARAS